MSTSWHCGPLGERYFLLFPFTLLKSTIQLKSRFTRAPEDKLTLANLRPEVENKLPVSVTESLENLSPLGPFLKDVKPGP